MQEEAKDREKKKKTERRKREREKKSLRLDKGEHVDRQSVTQMEVLLDRMVDDAKQRMRLN